MTSINAIACGNDHCKSTGWQYVSIMITSDGDIKRWCLPCQDDYLRAIANTDRHRKAIKSLCEELGLRAKAISMPLSELLQSLQVATDDFDPYSPDSAYRLYQLFLLVMDALQAQIRRDGRQSQ